MIRLIPLPLFMCLAPLNNNLSIYWMMDSWGVCGGVAVAVAAGGGIWQVSIILIYCASSVWLRMSSSLVA